MLTPDQLRDKALLALEDAVQECRYRTPRRSFAVRFALAYLWATSRAERRPFEDYWRALAAPKSPWSYGIADGALETIYRAIGIKRNEQVMFAMWGRRRREEEEGNSL